VLVLLINWWFSCYVKQCCLLTEVPAGDPQVSAAGCRLAIHDVFFNYLRNFRKDLNKFREIFHRKFPISQPYYHLSSTWTPLVGLELSALPHTVFYTFLLPPQLGIAIPDLNFQSRDSGLSNSQSRDPRSRRDWRSIVKTTKIATCVILFGSLFLSYKCVGPTIGSWSLVRGFTCVGSLP